MTLTVPDFSPFRILVAGDAMLDEYLFGDTRRISPEAPVPIVKTRTTEQRPGGAANVALNVAALGGQVRLLAIVGDDARAEVLTQLLSSAGVDCEFIEASGLPITHLAVGGTYVAEIRPGAPGRYEKPGFKLEAAVVETPNGPYFVKLVGPARTIDRWSASVTSFLESVRYE